MWEINVTDLKEDVLRLQLVPPDRVDDVHAVVEEVAAAGHDHERPPPVGVGPGPGEEGVSDRRDGLFECKLEFLTLFLVGEIVFLYLQHAVPRLQHRDVLLHLDLDVGV